MRRYFVIACPKCNGQGQKNVQKVVAEEKAEEKAEEGSITTIWNTGIVTCPLCEGHQRLIVRVCAPLIMPEATYP